MSRSHIRSPQLHNTENDEISLREWPTFSQRACPGFVGEFVHLAVRQSEADEAAVTMTFLARFSAEIYGYMKGKGPHIYVGETPHPPRIFAIICGNSSKARKGTSKHPVSKLFERTFCTPEELRQWQLPLPAQASGGPLSTGEGLAAIVRDETDEERERKQRMNPDEPLREKGDKRLIVMDEEFASALACTRREGNTLSMAVRSFWDSGDYQPLTKNNPISVSNAHVCLLSHITMQELSLALTDVQALNGFANRFLWCCARRSKLVALPSRMPDSELAVLQRELWKLVGIAQKREEIIFTAKARDFWCSIYSQLSREYPGLAGCIINRAEAQTLRLSLVYALLDGQGSIDEKHLQAALAMWQYAQDSAIYIFGDRAADPIEQKIIDYLTSGEKTATEINKYFSGHINKERLQMLLQDLEARRKITLQRQKGNGRPRLIITLSGESGKSHSDERGRLV